MNDEHATLTPDESGVFWRQDTGDGGYLYFLRRDDGAFYAEIRQDAAALGVTLPGVCAEQLLGWLDKSSETRTDAEYDESDGHA